MNTALPPSNTDNAAAPSYKWKPHARAAEPPNGFHNHWYGRGVAV